MLTALRANALLLLRLHAQLMARVVRPSTDPQLFAYLEPLIDRSIQALNALPADGPHDPKILMRVDWGCAGLPPCHRRVFRRRLRIGTRISLTRQPMDRVPHLASLCPPLASSRFTSPHLASSRLIASFLAAGLASR